MWGIRRGISAGLAGAVLLTCTGLPVAAAAVSPSSRATATAAVPVTTTSSRTAATTPSRPAPTSPSRTAAARRTAKLRPVSTTPARTPKTVPVHPLRTWEWRRLDLTPVEQLTAAFGKFKQLGGTTVALDISYVVDISEIAQPAARASASRAYTQRLRAYVAAAAQAGLAVEAAAGSPHWIAPDIRYVNGIVAAFVGSFNTAAPAGQRLTGLHFDLEPWGTPEWSRNSATLTKHLLDTVAEIAAKQRSTPAAARVPVSIDLPFWLDGTTAPKSVKHAGRSASPTEHVMRLLDNGAGQPNSVVIMAYRDETGGVDGSLAVSAAEMALASSFAGRVLVTIGQEAGNVAPERITFHEEGLDALLAAMATLRSAFGHRTGFGGFAVDDLAALERLA